MSSISLTRSATVEGQVVSYLQRVASWRSDPRYPHEMPGTYSILRNIGDPTFEWHRELPIISEKFQEEIRQASGSHSIGRHQRRTDDALNFQLEQAGSSLRCVILNPPHPTALNDLTSPFSSDVIILGPAHVISEAGIMTYIFEPNEEVSTAPDFLESERDGEIMIIRRGVIADKLGYGLQVALGTLQVNGGERERQMTASALSAYGILKQRDLSSEKALKFIDERAECLGAQMMAEFKMELKDHNGPDMWQEGACEETCSLHYSLYPYGVYIGMVAGKDLFSFYKMLRGMVVLEHILERHLPLPETVDRMMQGWLAFCGDGNLINWAKQKHVNDPRIAADERLQLARMEITRVKDTADAMTRAAVKSIMGKQIAEAEMEGVRQVGEWARSVLGYSPEQQLASRLAYRHLLLAQGLTSGK